MNNIDVEVPQEPVEDPGYIDGELENQIEPDEPAKLTIDVNSPNLVPELEADEEGAKFLNKLVMEIHDEFMQAWDKNADYRSKVAEQWRVLFCDLPPKSKPFEHCANAAIPLALQNVVRLTNKMTTEVFGDWSEPFNFIPTNPESEPIAPIVSQHSNWQIRNRMPGFKRQMKRAILIYAVAGDIACHSYYDPITRQNCHEMLTCDDYVVPYSHVSVNPDFSDLPWIARRFPYYKHRLKQMGKKAGWANVEKVTSYDAPEYTDGQAETTLRDAVSEFMGEDPFGQKKGEYEIVQYEGWMELPGMESEVYCQLIFDLCSKIPLKLTVHMRAPYHERIRFQMQQQELQQFQQQSQQLQMATQQKEMQVQQLIQHAQSLPQDSPDVGTIVQQAQQANAQPLPPQPIPPSWMADGVQEPEPPRKEPIYMFAHGVCLEPILGSLGIGLGRIDGQLNIATNTVWSMFLDASALGNGKTFITSSNVDFAAPFRIGPGVINKAKNVMPSDLQNAFLPIEFGAANPQLIEAADRFMQYGEQGLGTTELLAGAAGKSGETARGYQSRVEQGMAMIQVPTMGFGDFAVQVMQNNCKLNAVFSSEEEIFYVNRYNEDLQVAGAQMVRAARSMYDNPYDIELVSDLQFRSRAQKVSEADEIVQLPNAMPDLAYNYAFKYNAIKQALNARGMQKFSRTLLGPPPPLPQNTFGLPPGTPGTAIGPEQLMQQQIQQLVQQGVPPQQAQQMVQQQQAAQQQQQQAQQGQQQGSGPQKVQGKPQQQRPQAA
jgi:hypothetical protein